MVLGAFIAALILSGVTAFPLQYELECITDFFELGADDGPIARWFVVVRDGLRDSYAHYPWLAYGTDWLAFAHIVIAVFFLGPLVNPVRNIWTLWAGLLACGLLLPLALICGPIRHIPFGWQMIDCSFGIFGSLPISYCLWITHRYQTGLTESPQEA
jgi:hypothetical protein